MSGVDNDERRRAIAEVMLRIIAREGLEAATVRRIAADVGYSTTVVTHYFKGKDELLMLAYGTLADHGLARFAAAQARDRRDLVGYLLSVSALSESGRALWRVYVAIWDRALRDTAFADELRRWTDTTLGWIATFLRELEPDVAAPERAARRLLATVQGMSVQLLFDPASWPEAEMRAALTAEIAQLLHVRQVVDKTAVV